MFTSSWLKDAGERFIRTLAQVLLGALTTNGATITSLDWQQTLSIAGTAGLVSLLMSVLAAGVGSTGTASATNAVVPNPANGQ